MDRLSAVLSVLVSLLFRLHAEEARIWTDRRGEKFEGELIAADAVRGTFQLAGGRKTTVPISILIPDDAKAVQDWRRDNPRAPLIDPSAMPPWPTEVVAESDAVRLAGNNQATGGANYESQHFAIQSDIKLPLGVVRDLAAVFEATRAAVMTVPLGLSMGIGSERYPVRLISQTNDYQTAGGALGSGGFFNGREMLILLPNLGIRSTTTGLVAEHQKQLFILKHEVSHQVVGRWTGAQPIWLAEGLAEIFAATPYTRGRYSFQNLESGLHDYLLKWRPLRDSRTLHLVAPSRLMSMSRDAWQAQVAAQRAYDLYDSAALLTYWFIRYDGRGDAANLAAYYDALRRRVPVDEAERDFLLRGRTREQLTGELQKLARKMAIDVRFESTN